MTRQERWDALFRRPTTDVVMIMLALTVCTLLLMCTLGVGLLVVFNAKVDIGRVVSHLTDLINTMIGAVVGYAAGRGAGGASTKDDSPE